MKFRKIFIIESFTDDGDLNYRLFAANKLTAEKIMRKHGGNPACRLLNKREHYWVDPNAVQRL